MPDVSTALALVGYGWSSQGWVRKRREREDAKEMDRVCAPLKGLVSTVPASRLYPESKTVTDDSLAEQ